MRRFVLAGRADESLSQCLVVLTKPTAGMVVEAVCSGLSQLGIISYLLYSVSFVMDKMLETFMGDGTVVLG